MLFCTSLLSYMIPPLFLNVVVPIFLRVLSLLLDREGLMPLAPPSLMKGGGGEEPDPLPLFNWFMRLMCASFM